MSNITLNTGNKTADDKYTLNGKKVIPVFYPDGGFIPSSYPTRIYSCFRLSSLAEVSDPSFEFINERDLHEVGKSAVTVNDGVTTTLELTCFGNGYNTLSALLQNDLLAYPIMEMGKNVTLAGHLALISASQDDNDVHFSSFFPNVQIKQTSAAGATDGESTFTVEIKTSNTCYHSSNYVAPVKEIFYDDGTGTGITNTAAPDGAILVFKLGDGNDNGVATAGPLAIPISPDLTGLSQYLYEIKVGGSATTSGITYGTSTGVLTWGTAPADGTKIEVTYFARWGAPAWDSDKPYGGGHIVSYNNAYYSLPAGTTSAAGVLPTGGSWTTYTGFGYDGSSGIGTPVVPHTSGNVSFDRHLDDEIS